MEKLRFLSLLLGLTVAMCVGGCVVEDDREPDINVDINKPKDDPDIIINPPSTTTTTTSGGESGGN